MSEHPLLPEVGYVRLATVLKVFPVCRTKWYAGVKAGIYPRPVRLGPRTAAYRVEEIRDLLERVSSENVWQS
jgi:predicted DNA-binding transcriptional regulator AlpA